MKIKAEDRKITGRKSKKLLIENKLPAVVYGPKRKSKNITVDRVEAEKVFQKAGYSKIIDFVIENEKRVGKVLIREVQFDPITDEILHISFYDLDVTKPVTAEVPVVTQGKSKAVEEKVGFLVIPFDTIEVRALPDKLPDHLVVDVSGLDEIGDNISVDAILLSDGVELTQDIDENATVAYIAPPQKEIVEEEKEEEVEEGIEEEEGVEEEEGEEAEESTEKAEGEGEDVSTKENKDK